MILLLSPAKSLDFDTPRQCEKHTKPRFLDDSKVLIDVLRRFSPAELSELMGISDALAVMNAGRYDAWKTPFTAKNARQAALAFNGDVYEGLDAPSLSADDLDFAQKHVRILSGLYGLLRPLDLIQPYRLEMGTRLETTRGSDLYAFWGERVATALAADLKAAQAKTLVNLASAEYFKAARAPLLKTPVVQPVFEDWSAGKYKVVSFFAKRARGAMARYAIMHRLAAAEGLKAFDTDGYAFSAEASNETRWVFRRRRD